MAKLIKDIHDLVDFLAGKNSANKQPPEKIDQVVYEVVIDLFNDNYKMYVKTQEISDFLLAFKRTKKVTATGNIATLPADYQHMRAIRTMAGKKVDLVEDKFWDGRKNSKVAPPSDTNPIARIEVPEADPAARTIEMHPAQDLMLEYFKAPAKPLYAYAVQGTRYVYDDDATIDVEFGTLLFPDIKRRVLSGLGINLRDRELTVYAEQAKRNEYPK
jgi:hypothetical protein